MRYDIELYIQVKNELVKQINRIKSFLVSFTPDVAEFYSPFDITEYISLLKMICLCTPDEYIKNYIPNQIQSFPTPPTKRVDEKACKYDLDFFTYTMYPLYNRAMSIIEENSDAKRTFSKKFCSKFLQIEELSKGFDTLFNESYRYHLQAIWRMIEPLPQYVISLSDAFIKYYKLHRSHLGGV